MSGSANAGATAGKGNNFTTLRYILAAMVLLQHSYHAVDSDSHRDPVFRMFGSLTGGDLAVDLFFSLSGYLISQSWLRRPELKPYLIARVLRIHPGFVVALMFSIVIAGILGTSDSGAFFSEVSWPKAVGGAFLLTMLGIPSAYVVPGGLAYSVNVALWSVGYEFRMYLLTPVLGRLGVLRTPLLIVALAAATSLVWAFAPLPPRIPTAINFAVIAPEGFARGATFFFWGAAFRALEPRLPLRWWVAVPVAVLLGLLLHNDWARRLLLPPLGSFLFFYLGLLPPLRISKWLDRNDITYGVYLYGWPVQGTIWYNFQSISPVVLFFTSLVGASVLGCASWLLVERPFLRLKARATGKTPIFGPQTLL